MQSRVNDILYRSSSPSRYATFLSGFYETESKTFCYSNAGHHPPLLVRRGEVSTLDSDAGFPIGMFENSAYSVNHAQAEALAGLGR